jgi:hypothetical protein
MARGIPAAAAELNCCIYHTSSGRSTTLTPIDWHCDIRHLLLLLLLMVLLLLLP